MLALIHLLAGKISCTTDESDLEETHDVDVVVGSELLKVVRIDRLWLEISRVGLDD